MITRSKWVDDTGTIFYTTVTYDCDGVAVSTTVTDVDGAAYVPVEPVTLCGGGGGGPASQFNITDGTITETVNGGDTILFDSIGLISTVVSAPDTVTTSINNGAPGSVITANASGQAVWQAQPSFCDYVGLLPNAFFNPLDHQFVVKNMNTGACERVAPSFPGANWEVTRFVGGLNSPLAMNQAVSTFQNFPSSHLQGTFILPSAGGFSGLNDLRLDFNFNLLPGSAGATFPAGIWGDMYAIDLRVRLDGVNIAQTIRTNVRAGEMGSGNPSGLIPAFTSYPDYINVHLSVLLGNNIAAGSHNFVVQYEVLQNVVTSGHTRTVFIGQSDWMVEANYV